MQQYNYTITREQSERLERDYEIADIIMYLHKAFKYVGGNITISDAIDKLMHMTRFDYEIKQELKSKTALGKI